MTVKNRYEKEGTLFVINDNFIIINKFNNDDLIKTKKNHSYIIPAIFYWESSKTFNSELNPNIPISLLNKYANEYADSIGFKNKLLNKKIYINIKSIAHKFQSKFSHSVIIVAAPGYYGSGGYLYKFKITPDKSNLEVEYVIKDEEKILEKATLILNNNDTEDFTRKNNASDSETLFVNDYLEIYDLHIKMLSKTLIDKLEERL